MAVSDKSIEHITKMLTRSINEISASVDVGYESLIHTTLNSKYNLYPNEEIRAVPKLRYFGLGLYGFYNTDDKNGSKPFIAKAKELDLYEPIPLRCVHVDEDLTSAERSLYRIRKEMNINGERYYCYYLKCIVPVDNTVKLTRTNPVSKEEEPYELSASELNPVPEIPTTSGETDGTITEVNVSLNIGLNWFGHEVLEGINAIYAGDLTKAKISEIGIYSGEDREVTGYNASNEEIRYTESIYTQLQYKICNVGSAITSSSYDGSRIFRLTNGAVLTM